MPAENVDQIGSGSQRHNQPATEGWVGGAHRIPDCMQPIHHRTTRDDQPAEVLCSPPITDTSVIGCSASSQSPKHVPDRAQHCGEHRRVPRRDKPAVGRQGRQRHLHRGVVTAPDAHRELV